jgi:hypothetical protein
MGIFNNKLKKSVKLDFHSHYIYVVLTDKPTDYSFETTINEDNKKISLTGFEMKGEIIGYSGIRDEQSGFQKLFKRQVLVWVNKFTQAPEMSMFSGYARPDDEGTFFISLNLAPEETERFLFVIDRMWAAYTRESGFHNCDDPDLNDIYKKSLCLSMNFEFVKELDIDNEVWWCKSFDITEMRLPTNNFYTYEKISNSHQE